MKHPITQAITDTGRIGSADRAAHEPSLASRLGPSGEHPIARAIDHLSRSLVVLWLLKAGPVAKQMNLESRGDSND